MASKYFLLICVQAVLLQGIFGQCLNRLSLPVPSCGCGGIPLELLQNQLILNQLPALAPLGPNVVNVGPSVVAPGLGGCGCVDNIIAAPAPTTVIQDSTVANNLANALQLLVVSSLLSNTLPNNNDLIVSPGPCGSVEYLNPLNTLNPLGGYLPYGGVNYIY